MIDKINDMNLFKENEQFELNEILILQSIEQRKLQQENKELKEEIKKLNDYIEDKENRINHPLKCNFYEIKQKAKEEEK
jgi:hypothetical protein